MGRSRHDGDCDIYTAQCNHSLVDGICTCGYGREMMRRDDPTQMWTEERRRYNESLRSQVVQVAAVLARLQHDPLDEFTQDERDGHQRIIGECARQLKGIFDRMKRA